MISVFCRLVLNHNSINQHSYRLQIERKCFNSLYIYLFTCQFLSHSLFLFYETQTLSRILFLVLLSLSQLVFLTFQFVYLFLCVSSFPSFITKSLLHSLPLTPHPSLVVLVSVCLPLCVHLSVSLALTYTDRNPHICFSLYGNRCSNSTLSIYLSALRLSILEHRLPLYFPFHSILIPDRRSSSNII